MKDDKNGNTVIRIIIGKIYLIFVKGIDWLNKLDIGFNNFGLSLISIDESLNKFFKIDLSNNDWISNIKYSLSSIYNIINKNYNYYSTFFFLSLFEIINLLNLIYFIFKVYQFNYFIIIK